MTAARKVNDCMRSRVKCLLVDDLSENLLALSTLLRRDDVELLEARSGVEALDLLLANDVALAVLDVQMPGMDGFELAELMRGSERTRDVPIIFVTAGSRDQHRMFQGYDSGAVDFLYKPIERHGGRHGSSRFWKMRSSRTISVNADACDEKRSDSLAPMPRKHLRHNASRNSPMARSCSGLSK